MRTDPANSPSTTLATIASTTVAFALSKGLSLDAIEARTGVAGLDLVDPDARLPDAVGVNLWRLLTEAFPDDALTIDMARAAPFSFLGGLAHGAQFAATLRAALEFMIANGPVLADRLAVTLTETGDEAVLSPFHPSDHLDQGRTAEVGLGVAWRLITDIVEGGADLLRVEFEFPPLGPPARYEAFFGAPVLFARRRPALVLRRACLDRPVRGANLQLFDYVDRHYAGVRRRIAADGFPTPLRPLRQAIVENAAHGVFDAGAAVRRSGLSVRTAQRLASRHGRSLQGMIDAVRRETAEALLADPTVKLSSIGPIIGYSDERAFRRAFKRWTGATPTQRREARAG